MPGDERLFLATRPHQGIIGTCAIPRLHAPDVTSSLPPLEAALLIGRA
jgi:hypothetical protein